MTTNPENTPSADAEPLVDFEQLLAAAADDPQILQELVTLYFDQAKEVMAKLVVAVNQRSAQDVDYLAHKLVGASLACGMSAMVAPLRELEQRARKGDLERAEELRSQAASRLEQVRAAVLEFIVKYNKSQSAA